MIPAIRGLRTRSALGFALLALALSSALSVSTYGLTRAYLLNQRETLGVRQAVLNASAIKGLLATDDPQPGDAVTAIGTGSGSRALLHFDEQWYAATVELDQSQIPPGVLRNAADGVASRQRSLFHGDPYLVVGAALPGLSAQYFEFVPLSEYERTMSTLLAILIIAASATTVAGAVAGWMVSKRVLRPLGSVAATAKAMSAGDLTGRLTVGPDRDLQPVAESFNAMAESLERRIDREVRFTADVSHELRTPLTAAGSAMNLALRSELPPRAAMAIGIAAAQLEQLRILTLELLEIARFDSGVAELNSEETDVVQLTQQIVAELGASSDVVRDELSGQRTHVVDRTRFQRVVANLIENADRYAGGVVRITLARCDGSVVVTVDDAGPGVPEDERVAIFGRFHRGETERAPGTPKGTGLGLSLVEEHMTLHGGSVHVTDSPQGGARFVVVFP